MEMKQMMEKLGAPQTHVGLKAMIAEIDEDNDGKVSFREVIIIPVLHISFPIITASEAGWRVWINALHFLSNFLFVCFFIHDICYAYYKEIIKTKLITNSKQP